MQASATLVYTIVSIGLDHRNVLYFNFIPVEREAFRWIQKYIGAFGGDPNKVTM
jgi:hypothetical protein